GLNMGKIQFLEDSNLFLVKVSGMMMMVEAIGGQYLLIHMTLKEISTLVCGMMIDTSTANSQESICYSMQKTQGYLPRESPKLIRRESMLTLRLDTTFS